MTKKILVVGASGQLAQALSKQNWPAGFSVQTKGRPDFDLTQAFDISGAALAINASAYTAVDKAESDEDAAMALNRDGPRRLAEACHAAGIPLIHVSTDYVFDGAKDGAYRESDRVAPQSAYGRSKAEGEAAIRAALKQYVILRTSWVFSPAGQNFVKTMLRLAETRDEIGVVADQKGRPTYAPDLASWIVGIAEALLAGRGKFGTFHAANHGPTNWHGFAEAIFAGAAKRGAKVPNRVKAIGTADYPTPARRPANSVLATDRLTALYGIAPRDWRHSLDDCLDALLGDHR